MDYISKIEGHPIKAECLKESPRLLDKTPYLYRPSFSNGYGYETLIGGTCGVNQLVQTYTISSTYSGVTRSATYSDGHLTVTGEYNEQGRFAYIEVPYIANHKVLVMLNNKTVTGGHIILLSNYAQYADITNTDSLIFTNASNVTLRIGTGTVREVYDQSYIPQFIDLTQMFGTTIADYVYTLESGTSGAGITWLKNNGFFGADYYPYNAGGLLSVKTSKKITTGKNLFNYDLSDATSGAKYVQIKVPNGTYTMSTSAPLVAGAAILFFMAGYQTSGVSTATNGVSNAISRTVTTTDGYITFAYRYIGTPPVYPANFDIQIEINNQATAYEPYVSHEYPLDDIELRGILKLDGNNNLYYDGDTYESNGSVTRKYGIVDLGSLPWVNDTTAISGIYNLKADLTEIAKPIPVTDIFNAICEVYQSISAYDVYNCNEGICTNADGSSIFVYDANYNTSSSASAFKTAMSGVYLIYELATPTTETADPFTNPMIVDGNGTEEFVDGRTVEMPVGHETIYVDNSDKTKLDNLPDISDSGDGKYLIKQENGKQILTAYSNELPAYPSADGNYRLNVSISDGVPVLSWELIES